MNLRPLALVLVPLFAAVVFVATESLATAPAGRYVTAVVDAGAALRDGGTASTVFDTKTQLTWQQAGPTSPMSEEAAADYCAALPWSGGHWRLPRIQELLSIVDFTTATMPAIDPTFTMPALCGGGGGGGDGGSDGGGGGGGVTATGATCRFWSSTMQGGLAGVAWFADFATGAIQWGRVSRPTDSYGNAFYVRCVK